MSLNTRELVSTTTLSGRKAPCMTPMTVCSCSSSLKMPSLRVRRLRLTAHNATRREGRGPFVLSKVERLERLSPSLDDEREPRSVNRIVPSEEPDEEGGEPWRLLGNARVDLVLAPVVIFGRPLEAVLDDEAVVADGGGADVGGAAARNGAVGKGERERGARQRG